MAAEQLESELSGKPVFFPTLDVLRFIAVFAVVLTHGFDATIGNYGQPNYLLSDSGELTIFGYYVNRFFANLNIGVDLFFIISGFLITYLLIKEKDKTGKIDVVKFYLRRSLRIWPLYFLVLFVFIPLVIKLTEQPAYDHYLWHASFLTNYRIISTNNFEFPFSHLWSISVEEHFYLFWPLLLFVIPIRRLPILFSAVIFASILFRIYVLFFSEHTHINFFMNTLSRMDELSIGGLIAWLHFNKKIEFRVHSAIRIMVYMLMIFALAVQSRYEYFDTLSPVFRKYLGLLFMIFLFMDFMFNPKLQKRFSKQSILHYFGKISFGIYLFHNLLIVPIAMHIMPQISNHNRWEFALIYIASTFAIAALSYEFIEKRILRFKDRFAIIATLR
ncbi:MAG: acyltransferase family protein [Bacteroidia bacterium]